MYCVDDSFFQVWKSEKWRSINFNFGYEITKQWKLYHLIECSRGINFWILNYIKNHHYSHLRNIYFMHIGDSLLYLQMP